MVSAPQKIGLSFYSYLLKVEALFSCNPIAVVTTFLLRTIVDKPELSGRLS